MMWSSMLLAAITISQWLEVQPREPSDDDELAITLCGGFDWDAPAPPPPPSPEDCFDSADSFRCYRDRVWSWIDYPDDFALLTFGKPARARREMPMSMLARL